MQTVCLTKKDDQIVYEIILEILSCEVAGKTACVKVRDKYLGSIFLDTLSFINIDGEWQIYNKLFHVESD